jgi:hypothetical protein
MQRRVRIALAAAGAAAAGLAVTAGAVQAGGALGWASAVQQVSDEGSGAGAAAVPLGIIMLGVAFMAMHQWIGTALAVLGGLVLVGNATGLSGMLVPGGGGGGSILSTTFTHQAGVGPVLAPDLSRATLTIAD